MATKKQTADNTTTGPVDTSAEKRATPDVLRKIKALLAHANDKACTPQEAEAFMAKVNEMLVAYNLDPEDVQPSEERQVIEEAVLFTKSPNTDRKLTQWLRLLAQEVAQANMCSLLLSSTHLYFIGRKTNIAATLQMYNWLVPTIRRATLASMAQKPSHVENAHWRRDFRLGVVNAIAVRLRRQREAMRTAGANNTAGEHSTALAVQDMFNARKAEVDLYIQEQYGKAWDAAKKAIEEAIANDPKAKARYEAQQARAQREAQERMRRDLNRRNDQAFGLGMEVGRDMPLGGDAALAPKKAALAAA